MAEQAGIATSTWSTGAAWGDFDRDGHLDLYVCSYAEYDPRVAHLSVSTGRGAGGYSVPFALNPNSFDPASNRLYRNRGDGAFDDVTAKYGVGDPEGRSFAATFVDLDGDGWLDLYVANDASPNKLFHNMLGVRAGSFYETCAPAATGENNSVGSQTCRPSRAPPISAAPWGSPSPKPGAQRELRRST